MFFENKTVLITGASGFLGYHIICAAIENGLEVYAAVRKTSNIEHLSNLPLQYLFLEGSCLLLFYSLRQFFQPGKWVKLLLFLFL